MRVMKLTCAALLSAARRSPRTSRARRAAAEVAARVPLEQAMKGAPYSAETLVEGSQTARRRQPDQPQDHRPRLSRQRRTHAPRRRSPERHRRRVSITDPVGRLFSYSLDRETSRLAHADRRRRRDHEQGGSVAADLGEAGGEERINAEGKRRGGLRVGAARRDEEKQKIEARGQRRRAIAGAGDARRGPLASAGGCRGRRGGARWRRWRRRRRAALGRSR